MADDTTTYLQQLVEDLDEHIKDEMQDPDYDEAYVDGVRVARLLASKARDEELS